MVNQQQPNLKRILKIAGAFIAWMIGSGFATGQEILQFFSSYGYRSYAVLIVVLVLFTVLGRILFTTGFDNKDQNFDHFSYYCGEKLGRIYSWLVPFTLILMVAVMTSAAGATLEEYYGIDRQIGSAIMAVAVVSSYLAGFEKMVGIVSSIGPVIILFALVVGATTVGKDLMNFSQIGQHQEALTGSQASSNWLLSALTYSSMCFFTAGRYFTALGQASVSVKEAKTGAFIGAVAFIMVVAIMNTAILLNAGDLTSQEIPTLYLAGRITVLLAGPFSIILVLGMFSTCATMMWSAASVFFKADRKRNQISAVILGIIILILGQFSFSKLLSVFYPLVGYAGLIYIAAVLREGFKKKTGARSLTIKAEGSSEAAID